MLLSGLTRLTEPECEMLGKGTRRERGDKWKRGSDVGVDGKEEDKEERSEGGEIDLASQEMTADEGLS